MSIVQALKRLITTNESPNTSAAATNDSNASVPDVTNTASHHPLNSTNGASATVSTSKSNESFKPLSQGLQKKYARGVQYNMKLIIRGECNTGKSVLWSRLQGGGFVEDYVPSDEIRVATINWTPRVCEDAIVKVEVWDVVDKSRKKRRPINPSLKLANNINLPVTEVSLDAEFLDVYKSTSGVLFVYDVTKPWTWDYIEREIVKVPAHIPILVVGNQLDLGHHRKVATEKCIGFLDSLDRGSMGSIIRYCEASMRNGFGLKYIYQFLNIPFLQLQRECLLQQLQINARDMDASLEEIDNYARSDENNYDLFIESLANKRRCKQEALAADVLAKAKPLEEAKRLHDEALQAAALAQQQQQANTTPLDTIVHVIKKTTENSAPIIKPTPTMKQKPPVVAVQPIVQQVVPKSPAALPIPEPIVEKQTSSDDYVEPRVANPLVASTVDDFVPEDNDYETFLVDDNNTQSQTISTDQTVKPRTTKLSTTDDENELTINPMVKGFREHLDSDDEQLPPPMPDTKITSYDEPESPLTQTILQHRSPSPESLPPEPAPVYHQMSSSDLDFLDQLTSSRTKSTDKQLQSLDTHSVASDSAVTKPKKKKTTTSKAKKDETATGGDTTKTKAKKKKPTALKMSNSMVESSVPTETHDDDDDLESFLADIPRPKQKNENDYEHV